MSSQIKPRFVSRKPSPSAQASLEAGGAHPLLARLFASRGIKDVSELSARFEDLLPYETLKNCVEMARELADIHARQDRILIVSDYDCDGATACSVLVCAFEAAGMNYGYLVPDRLVHGYGLTPSIVDEAAAMPDKPRFIITVDNGISSTAGIERARELGIEVLVTDHHLAPAVLPPARLIVNPNQPGCEFQSKNIAGCGVAWYVAWALFDELERRGIEVYCDPQFLLTYVALGTVADVVQLDRNNRVLVSLGLELIRNGTCPVGISALASVAKRKLALLSTSDIGFALGPRINAAGRLAHMSAGIECLTTSDANRAAALAQQLDDINKERKQVQAGALGEALAALSSVKTRGSKGLVAYSSAWHEGVVGIVAGRIKELHHRPTFVLCDAQDGHIKGSGRSIAGFHLKHALDAINARIPGLLLKYGGHAMAAGATIEAGRLDEFERAFEQECMTIDPGLLERVLEHDGPLTANDLSIDTIHMLNQQVWGQGFAPPVFLNKLAVHEAKVLGQGGEHLKLRARLASVWLDALAFGMGEHVDLVEPMVTVAHQPSVNDYNDRQTVQLTVVEVRDGIEQPMAMAA